MLTEDVSVWKRGVFIYSLFVIMVIMLMTAISAVWNTFFHEASVKALGIKKLNQSCSHRRSQNSLSHPYPEYTRLPDDDHDLILFHDK